MGFYGLEKEQRNALVEKINREIAEDLRSDRKHNILQYFSDEDTYVRKAAYVAYGRMYATNKKLQTRIIHLLEALLDEDDHKVRQTATNAAGEIGKEHFDLVRPIFDKGLLDQHHSVRNAVIGSMKKMGEKNPVPIIEWSRKYLHHPDKEIRREICHGIELRGRTHPEDILPLLKEQQFDKTSRVRSTLVHVMGQISYKKGCLEKVMNDIMEWENTELIKDMIDEIIDVHDRYRNFSFYTQEEVKEIIEAYKKKANP